MSSSWVLDGLIDCLVGDNSGVEEFLTQHNLCFHIIPMLNPDGVVVGNYRTGIIGEDFNRRFASGKRDVFPEIYLLKKMITDAKK